MAHPILRSLLIPADGIDAAIAFYRDALGMRLQLRDGDRYAALDAGGISLAIATPDEHPSPLHTVLSFRAENVVASVERLVASGARLISAPACGTHEVRALLRAPDGAWFALYESLR